MSRLPRLKERLCIFLIANSYSNGHAGVNQQSSSRSNHAEFQAYLAALRKGEGHAWAAQAGEEAAKRLLR